MLAMPLAKKKPPTTVKRRRKPVNLAILKLVRSGNVLLELFSAPKRHHVSIRKCIKRQRKDYRVGEGGRYRRGGNRSRIWRCNRRVRLLLRNRTRRWAPSRSPARNPTTRGPSESISWWASETRMALALLCDACATYKRRSERGWHARRWSEWGFENVTWRVAWRGSDWLPSKAHHIPSI